MVRSGAMRHEVTIQQPATAQDGAGQPSRAWTTFATRRAAVQRTTGSELVESARRNARVSTVFRLRYLAGVTTKMRVVWSGKVFNIVSAIDQEGLGEELVVTAEELVGVAP